MASGQKGKDQGKKASKHFVVNRFLVYQQNTFGFRNARRIFEIGLSTVQILDFHGIVRAEYSASDIVSVKLGNDSDSIFVIHFPKVTETFMCGKRAELLSVLLPIIQKDEGAPIFELSKWRKAMHIDCNSPAAARPFAWYKLWAGKLMLLFDGNMQMQHMAQSEICLNTVVKISAIVEDPAGAVIFLKGRTLVRFSCYDEVNCSSVRQFAARDRFIQCLVESAKAQLGLTIPILETSNAELRSFCEDYLLKKPDDVGSLLFSVTVRRYGRDFHNGKVKRRVLELHERCIFERDSESPCLIHRRVYLNEINCLIRPEEFTDVFGLRLEDQSSIWFSSEERDCILINILELAELNGMVQMLLSHEIPLSSKLKGSAELEREYEDSLLADRISSPCLKEDGAWRDFLDSLNDNLTLPGASRCTSKKPLLALLQALTEVSTDPCGLSSTPSFGNSLSIGILAVMQKIAYSRTCFEEAALLKKESVWATMLALVQSSDDILSYSAVTTLKAYTCYQPSKEMLWKNEKYRANIEKAENINRSVLLDADMMTLLLGRLKSQPLRGDSPSKKSSLLTIYAILDLLCIMVQGSIYSTGSNSQRASSIVLNNQQMITLSQHLGSMMGTLCRLSRGPGLGIVRRGSILQEWTVLSAPSPSPPPHRRSPPRPVKSPTLTPHGVQDGLYLSSGQVYSRTALQDEARGNGQVLWQLYLAAASNVSPVQRSVSEHLVELFVEENPRSWPLLHRILPSALMLSLSVRWQEPSTAALTSRSGAGSAQGGSGGARRTVSNWPLLWERLRDECEGPELVWHSRAREELLSALLAELEALEEAGGGRVGEDVVWNDEEYYVAYQTLKSELKVGRYYVRFLLDKSMGMEGIQGPQKFLGQLYHRFLTEPDSSVQVMCLRAMARVYEHYNNQPFDRYALASLIRLLQEPCLASPSSPSPSSPWSLAGAATHSGSAALPHRGLQDDVTTALLAFIAVAIRNDSNAQTLLLSCDLVPLLVRLAARANEGFRRRAGPFPRAEITLSCPEENAVTSEAHADSKEDARSILQAAPGSSPNHADAVDRKEMDVSGGTGVVTDSAVSALHLVETLVCRTRCVSDTGARLRPLPLVVRLVCSQELLPHLLPLLLTPNPVVVSAVIRILEASLTHAPANVLLSLLSLGPVPMLLLALLNAPPESTTAASLTSLLKLLYASSNIDDASLRTKAQKTGSGHLVEDWLPEGLCLILGREEVWLGRFVEALYWGAEEAECRPWIVWSEDMRNRLCETLRKLLQPFLDRLAVNSLARFEYPEHVWLPNYTEALDACWLDLSSVEQTHWDSSDSGSKLHCGNSLEMGYYLDSLARHAVAGRALAIAAGDAERLSAHILERLNASPALEPAHLPETIKLLQVYSALVLQHTVQVHPLEPLVRRILLSCAQGDDTAFFSPEPSDDTDESSPPMRLTYESSSSDHGRGAGPAGSVDRELVQSRIEQLSEALRWGLCALASGGLFGEDMEAEVSLIRSILKWNANSRPSQDADQQHCKLSADSLETRESADTNRSSKAIGQIRSWALRCAATLFRSPTHGKSALKAFAVCEGEADAGNGANLLVGQIEAAFLDYDPDEVSAASCCVTAYCSGLLSFSSSEECEDDYGLGASLLESQVPLLILMSLLKSGDVLYSTDGSEKQLSMFTAYSRRDSIRLPDTDRDLTLASLFPIVEDSSPFALEMLYKNALKKVEALSVVAREASRRCEAVAADDLGRVLRVLLTPALYQRLLEGDVRYWLSLFFGEQMSPDIVWGSENREHLSQILTELLLEGSRPCESEKPLLHRLCARLEGFRYENLSSLTPVAGVYLELLPLGACKDRPVLYHATEIHDMFVGSEEMKDIKLVPEGWPILDLDVFIGNVIDLLAHGLDDSGPTPAQVRAALDVLFHLAMHCCLIKAKQFAENAEIQPVDVITSQSRAEVLLSLLQLPQNDVSTRAITYHTLRLLVLATKSHAAAMFCLSCSCRQVPSIFGMETVGRLFPLDVLLSRAFLSLFVIKSGALAVEDPDRLLQLLLFVCNLARAAAGTKRLDLLAQHCLVEGCILLILLYGCDEMMMSKGLVLNSVVAQANTSQAREQAPHQGQAAAGTCGDDAAAPAGVSRVLDTSVLSLCAVAGSLVETLSSAGGGGPGVWKQDSDGADSDGTSDSISSAGRQAAARAAGEKGPAAYDSDGSTARACSPSRPALAAGRDSPAWDGSSASDGPGPERRAELRPGPGVVRIRACLPAWMVEAVSTGRQKLAVCLLQDREPLAAAESGPARLGWNHVGRRALWWHLVDQVSHAQRAIGDAQAGFASVALSHLKS